MSDAGGHATTGQENRSLAEDQDYRKLVGRFEHVYDRLADLQSGLKKQGNYEVAGYVGRAIRSLDDAISGVLADTASAQDASLFGTYVEREDGTTEFRRTGEPHTPTALGYKCWTLYQGPARPVGSKSEASSSVAPAPRSPAQQSGSAPSSDEECDEPPKPAKKIRLTQTQKDVLRHCQDWSAAFEVAERRVDEGARTTWWQTQDVLRSLQERGLVRFGEANGTYRITDEGMAALGLETAGSSIEGKHDDRQA